MNTHDQLKIPPLKNPRQISSGLVHTCALTDNGVECWGAKHIDGLKDANFGQVNAPYLKNPRQISSGGYHTCALTDEGVKCWGALDPAEGKKVNFGQAKVPYLKNPRQISSGWVHTCALTDDGVQCWGKKDQIEVPKELQELANSPVQFTLETLERSLIKTSTGVANIKNGALLIIASELEKQKIDSSKPLYSSYKKLLARLYALLITGPFLSQIESDYLETKVYPNYLTARDEAYKSLEVSSIHQIEVTPEIIRISISALRAALESSKYYLSKLEQEKVDQIVAGLAEVLANSRNETPTATAKRITAILNAHADLTVTLVSSSNTAAMGAMIAEITGYMAQQ